MLKGLEYGFNEPESGFVWSTFNFGMSFDPRYEYVVLQLYYQHERVAFYYPIARRAEDAHTRYTMATISAPGDR